MRAHGAWMLTLTVAVGGCTDASKSPIGVDLLPGGILDEGIQIVSEEVFAEAVDYPLFPSERAEAERLVTSVDWPEDPGIESRIAARFDFSGLDSLEAGTEFSDLRLRLTYSPAPEVPVTLTVHRLRSAWDEEAATWTRRRFGDAWGTPGGDFDVVPLAIFSIEPDQPDSVAADSAAADSVEIALPIELLEDWRANPDENHGVIVVQETSGTTVDWVSRGIAGLNPNGPTIKMEVQQPDSPQVPLTLIATEDIFIAVDNLPRPQGGLVVSGAEPVRRIYIEPLLNAVPEGATVALARLILTIESARFDADSLTVIARQALTDFVGEKTVYLPVTSTSLLGFAVVSGSSQPGDTVVFEATRLTSLVRSRLRNPDLKRGLGITVLDEEVAIGGIRFYGPEAAEGLRPRLELFYVPPQSEIGGSE